MKNLLRLIPYLILVGIYILLGFYCYPPISRLLNVTFVQPLIWFTTLAIATLFILAIIRIDKHGIDRFFKLSAHLFLIAFTAQILMSVVLLLGDVLAFGNNTINYFTTGSFTLLPRLAFWNSLAIVIFFITVVLFIYGIVKGKYAYRVIKHTLYFKELPAAFEGFTITQISDVHAGSFTNIKAVEKGINLINQQQSDLFVFTGDLVNNKAEEIIPYLSIFSKIKAKYGQFSVLGNHDYGDYIKWPSPKEKAENLNQLKANHQKLGFRLLLDEQIKIVKEGAAITLVGIENWGLGFGERGDLNKALGESAAADFKILLSHDPSHWEQQVKNNQRNIQLTLAGHTHGMQFGIEALGLKWSPVKYRYKHWAGIKEENDRILNINRGFGFIGFSGRIGIWPEITVLELRKKQ